MINDFLKRVSIAELLTIIFIFSVGVSLLYKYGFYDELGIGWYLNTLSPQQLFLSSFKFLFFSMLGMVIGISFAILSYKYFESVMALMIVIMGAFFLISTFNISILKREFFLLLIFLISFLYITKMNYRVTDEKGQKLSEIKWEDRTIGDRIVPPLFTLLLVSFLFWMVFSEGRNEAKNIINPSKTQTIIQIKEKKDKWTLIEINGDKVLMMKNGKNREFKIIEYKEIQTITTK